MKNLITYTAVLLCIATMLLGCYSQQKAKRQLLKAQTKHPNTVAQLCAAVYPPLALVKDSVVYLKGDIEEEIVYAEVDCDSVHKVLKGASANIVRVPCPPAQNRIDTLLVYKERQVVNKAAVQVLDSKLEETASLLAKKKHENYILLRVAIVLALYTLLRWVLRIWQIKLP